MTDAKDKLDRAVEVVDKGYNEVSRIAALPVVGKAIGWLVTVIKRRKPIREERRRKRRARRERRRG